MASQNRGSYPADIVVEFPENPSRLLGLLGVLIGWKALLLIPHGIILSFLGIVAMFAVYLGYWVVLVTGRYPRGLFDFGVGVQRWSFRATAWLSGWTDRYPPFSLG